METRITIFMFLGNLNIGLYMRECARIFGMFGILKNETVSEFYWFYY